MLPAAPVLAACAVVLAAVVPCLAGGSRAAKAAAGVLLAAALLASGGWGGVLLSLLPLAGFAVLLAGSALLLRRLGAPPAFAAALAGCLGCALLGLPFLGDPLVEPAAAGRPSRAAIGGLVGGSPLMASLGGGLGADPLRGPRAYGGLSRIGPFYDFSYPRPLAAGLAFAVLGGALLGLSLLPGRRPRG